MTSQGPGKAPRPPGPPCTRPLASGLSGCLGTPDGDSFCLQEVDSAVPAAWPCTVGGSRSPGGLPGRGGRQESEKLGASRWLSARRTGSVGALLPACGAVALCHTWWRLPEGAASGQAGRRGWGWTVPRVVARVRARPAHSRFTGQPAEASGRCVPHDQRIRVGAPGRLLDSVPTLPGTITLHHVLLPPELGAVDVGSGHSVCSRAHKLTGSLMQEVVPEPTAEGREPPAACGRPLGQL